MMMLEKMRSREKRIIYSILVYKGIKVGSNGFRSKGDVTASKNLLTYSQRVIGNCIYLNQLKIPGRRNNHYIV